MIHYLLFSVLCDSKLNFCDFWTFEDVTLSSQNLLRTLQGLNDYWKKIPD